MARTKLSCRMKCGGLPPRPRSDTHYMSALSESSESTLQSESGSESETPPRSTKRSRMSGEEAGAEVRALAVPCVVHRKEKEAEACLASQVSSRLVPSTAGKPAISLCVRGMQEVVADEHHPLKVHQHLCTRSAVSYVTRR